ncbi:MAG TPA: serine/threonine-protein kinase, partial [Nannocystaceae bacterium]|nr:serine/threonine-protein kinase [Nannocystaceae bacterium]
MSASSEDPALAVEPTLANGSAPTEPRPGLEYRELKGRVRSALFGASADPVKIARFAVLRRLGSGGMGVVYSAYDDELDRKVAIKLLRPDLFGDEGQLRLRREAQAVAKLSHPNVVGVFETGVHDGRVFVAMEFVHGRTLGAWSRAASHGWTTIVDVFLQAGQGLLAAHAVGLVHRDFKPDNVMVGDDGRVRVLDFGVARAVALPDAATAPGDGALSSALTVTGAVVGTPAYMAPEQLAGETADARTDQYAFCLTLWEALFGESAF